MSTNNWNEEQRRRQAAAIRRWRPWESSTGPRSVEGKATVSKNATKHSTRTRTAQDIEHAIATLLTQTVKAWGNL
jgi:hypothetical protein